MSSFFKKQSVVSDGVTTHGFYLGSPEAEAENKNQKQNLVAFFEDYMGIQDQIIDGKFIISGRKGSGKSAFVKYLMDKSGEEAGLFCELIKTNEFDLEKMIQMIPVDQENKYGIIFEWIILTRFVNLILKSKNATYTKEQKALEAFVQRNSGVVEIDRFAIVEVNQSRKIDVNIAPLREKFGVILSKMFSNTTVKAPFYCLIPTLREIVIKVLSFEVCLDADLVLLFDDLDVKFKLANEQDKTKLLDLIRITKRYNNEYLAATKGKILIFMRDDIGKHLDGIDSDKNKLFGSYEYKLNWYNYESAMMSDKDILLRRFINKRIGINFKTLNIPYNHSDPWETLVDDSSCTEYGGKTAFKYILGFTFYRPRDFVNIFKDIGMCNYPFPLTPISVKALLKRFVNVNVGEIKDELSILFDRQTIDGIFLLLKTVSRRQNLSYDDILELMNRHDVDEDYFPFLIDYCLLIPKDRNGFYYFNYREQPLIGRLEEFEYTLPKCLYIYFNPNAI